MNKSIMYRFLILSRSRIELSRETRTSKGKEETALFKGSGEGMRRVTWLFKDSRKEISMSGYGISSVSKLSFL